MGTSAFFLPCFLPKSDQYQLSRLMSALIGGGHRGKGVALKFCAKYCGTDYAGAPTVAALYQCHSGVGRNPGQWHQREASHQACMQHKETDGLQCSLSGLRLPAFAGTGFAATTGWYRMIRWYRPHSPCLGNAVFGRAAWIPVPRLRGDKLHGNDEGCGLCLIRPASHHPCRITYAL